MEKLPRSLQELVEQFAEFPGVGPKSALRMALTLLKWPKQKVHQLGQDVSKLRENLCICSQCASLSDSDPCSICADPVRSEEELCLVSDWDSLLVMEEAGFFQGKYLVLGGLLSPLDGVQPQSLELQRLRARLDSGLVREVILALGTTAEGENTESYVKNLIESEYPKAKVSRLAQGIPLGAELKYIDRETLKQSLTFRQNL